MRTPLLSSQTINLPVESVSFINIQHVPVITTTQVSNKALSRNASLHPFPPSPRSPHTQSVDATCLTSSLTHKHCQEAHARRVCRQSHSPPHQQIQPQPHFKHAAPSAHIFFDSLFTLFLISGTNLEANVIAHEMTRPLQDPQPLLQSDTAPKYILQVIINTVPHHEDARSLHLFTAQGSPIIIPKMF